MDPSPDDLRGLLALQETDSAIRRIEHRLDDLPEQRALDDVTARDRELEGRHDELRAELSTISAEQRRLEGEVDLLRQRRDAEQARMYGGEIVNPRELQSLRAELESTARRISEHEDDLLEVLEQVEGLEGREAVIQEERQELAGERERLAGARDDAAKELIAEQAELAVQRDHQRAALPDDLLSRYDAATEQARGGIAVGALQGSMCTACRIELPMVEVNDLLDGPPLVRCPQCRRLMVVGL